MALAATAMLFLDLFAHGTTHAYYVVALGRSGYHHWISHVASFALEDQIDGQGEEKVLDNWEQFGRHEFGEPVVILSCARIKNEPHATEASQSTNIDRHGRLFEVRL